MACPASRAARPSRVRVHSCPSEIREQAHALQQRAREEQDPVAAAIISSAAVQLRAHADVIYHLEQLYGAQRELADYIHRTFIEDIPRGQ